MSRFQFPPWTNKLTLLVLGFGGVLALYGVSVGMYATSPTTINIGYSPKQPIPFSHKLHAGQLKMDCRYCHTTVDKSAFAAIPDSKICANCHTGKSADGTTELAAVHSESAALAPLRESLATGKSIPWVKVHNLPDFVYFDHSAHVTRGVSCVSCHDRVDRMDEVFQAKPLSMSWCLDCHRNPTPHLRPLDKITELGWVPEESPLAVGKRVHEELNIKSSTNCSTCHR